MISEILEQYGYKKQEVTGELYLIGYDQTSKIEIKLAEKYDVNDIQSLPELNINSLPNCPEYLKTFKDPLNKIEIKEGIFVYRKNDFMIELNQDKMFYYLTA